jgi:hypothetical protein
MSQTHAVRPLIRVALPVAIAVVLVCLAVIDIALVKTWRGEPEDGVLWAQEHANVIAREVAPQGAGAAAGILPRDVLLKIDDKVIESIDDVIRSLHASTDGKPLQYLVSRQSAGDMPLPVTLQPVPLVRSGLYFSLALVGILAIVVGASVRLRRPNDPATLHFFWLTVAFFGALAFTPSGSYRTLDYFFDWRCRRCSCTSRSSSRSARIPGSARTPGARCCR